MHCLAANYRAPAAVAAVAAAAFTMPCCVQVVVRACTGDPSRPIIVDVNNLQQQIYVYGAIRWEGNIKFVNSWPSPRRGGLFPLISVLSVEGNGTIEFQVRWQPSASHCMCYNLPCTRPMGVLGLARRTVLLTLGLWVIYC
jgi:hypothetical protein